MYDINVDVRVDHSPGVNNCTCALRQNMINTTIGKAISASIIQTYFFFILIPPYVAPPSFHRLDHGLDEGNLFGCEVVFGVEFGVGPGLREVLDGNETVNFTWRVLRNLN